MAKKILVAVDESKNSMKAVEYVAKSMQPAGTVTLLSVIPDATAACDLDSPSLTPLFKQ
ncbi:MAG: universal stress protein, partial [Deltaproteobacteria bacterium]|nr:universal stress protein [Deltaproteobacteria bacterium]